MSEEQGNSKTEEPVKPNQTFDEIPLAYTPLEREKDSELKVKAEYVLTELHPSLTPPPNKDLIEKDKDTGDGTKKNRHKQNVKNMNKRGRDDVLSGMKLCKATMAGEVCAYGDSCKYSHDIKELLSMREPDIQEIEGGCPNYNAKGICQYGIGCRVGASHLNLATGANLTKDKIVEDDVKNLISHDTLSLLRKKKYKFVCKRHFEKKKGKSREEEDAEAAKAVVGGAEENHDSPVTKTEEADEKHVDTTPYPQLRKIIDFRNKVYVAPLTTVGNLPFRRIMKRMGADITCGEMAVSTCLLQGKVGEWALVKRHKDEDIFGIQITAGYPDVYTRLSEVIKNEELDVDFVDMNLGCPIDVICNTGAGAKMMLRESALRDSIKGMSQNLSCPITVKMRIGWDEKKPNAHTLVKKIQKWGMGNVGAIMIHGRSRLQRYSKLANWDYINMASSQQVDDLPKIPLIGNGDIFSYKDYEEKVLSHPNLSPTAMIGRGALIKPWLPTEIKEKRDWDISSSERLDILKDFVKFGLEHWGSDQHGVNTTRRFLLEWQSFLHRYIPVGLLEVASIPACLHQRPPQFICGRNDLETLMMSKNVADWIKISEMLLGPVPEGFHFEPKHKANSYRG